MATYVVTTPLLNLREGPGPGFPILARLPAGQELEAVGESADGRWIRGRASLRDGDVAGWASARYLAPAPARTAGYPAWFAAAHREIGVHEYPGPADNPRIVEYHQVTSLRASDDEVAWCSAFANWCMTQAGIRGTGSAAARSWLEWGRPLPQPRPGCIVVFARGSDAAQGHVAFFVQHRGVVLDVLGGNQGNQVKVAPYAAQRVLGYRWPQQG